MKNLQFCKVERAQKLKIHPEGSDNVCSKFAPPLASSSDALLPIFMHVDWVKQKFYCCRWDMEHKSWCLPFYIGQGPKIKSILCNRVSEGFQIHHYILHLEHFCFFCTNLVSIYQTFVSNTTSDLFKIRSKCSESKCYKIHSCWMEPKYSQNGVNESQNTYKIQLIFS